MELGSFRPVLTPLPELGAGEVGYIATGLKNVKDCQVGDTITAAARPAAEPLPGYKPAQPMVFAGFYPMNGEDYPLLRDALDRLQLNDASLTYEPESSVALGFGFRCGFLGLLHMEIIQERLEREYNLELLATAPSVEYQVIKTDGTRADDRQPGAAARPWRDRRASREPWVKAEHLHAHRLHRRDHGAVPGAPRRVSCTWPISTSSACRSTTTCRSPS